MRIEVLFPELGNLYGDHGNIQYLTACVPETEVIYTGNLQEPEFVRGTVDLIYLGSMSEKNQELAIGRLAPYADRLKGYIEKNGVLLATGNALELFGAYIQEDRRRIPALGLFPYHSVRDMEHRHNSMFLGTFGGMKIVGTRSQFSFSYGELPHPFLQVTGGIGMNPEAKTEGVHYRNFFATYLLGPFWCSIPCLPCICWRSWDIRGRWPFSGRRWRRIPTGCGNWSARASVFRWESTADSLFGTLDPCGIINSTAVILRGASAAGLPRGFCSGSRFR